MCITPSFRFPLPLHLDLGHKKSAQTGCSSQNSEKIHPCLRALAGAKGNRGDQLDLLLTSPNTLYHNLQLAFGPLESRAEDSAQRRPASYP